MMLLTSPYRRSASAPCLAEIRIDNPVLLEILTRYRQLGALGESIAALSIAVGEPKIYAFRMNLEDRNDRLHAPRSLSEVVPILLRVLDENLYAPWGIKIPRNEPQFRALIRELDNRKLEIEASYESVYWCSEGKRKDGTPCAFVYDRGEEEDELIYGTFDI